MHKFKVGDIIIGGNIHNNRVWIWKLEEILEWPKVKGRYIYDSNNTAKTESHFSVLLEDDHKRLFTPTKLERIIYGITDETVS